MTDRIRTRNLTVVGDNDLIVVDILGGSELPQSRDQPAVDEITVGALVDVDGDTVRESLDAGSLTGGESDGAIV